MPEFDPLDTSPPQINFITGLRVPQPQRHDQSSDVLLLLSPQSAAQSPGLSSQATPSQTAAGGIGLPQIVNAFYGQESGYGQNTKTSSTGAVGPMQIEPGTWKQYAATHEQINNSDDNRAVGGRILSDYYNRYGGDPARMAVAYFSGPGNVAPPGSPTPWLRNTHDPSGKTVSSYVSDIMGRIAASSAPKRSATRLRNVGSDDGSDGTN